MKKLDKVLILTILLIAAVLMGFNYFRSKSIAKNSKDLVAEISVKGKVYKNIVLSNEKQEFTIKTELGENTVKAHDKGIEIINASCHDHICEKTGFISRPGEMIVCLPNKVAIKIKGNSGEDIDGISR
jgi:hypothetical protein